MVTNAKILEQNERHEKNSCHVGGFDNSERFLAGIFGFKRAAGGCVRLMRWSFRAMARLGFATKNANILVVPRLLLIGITPENTFGIVGKSFSAKVVKRPRSG